MSTLKYLFSQLGKYRLKLILVFVITILFVLLSLIQNLLFSFAIDNLINDVPLTRSFISSLVNISGGKRFWQNHLYLVALVMLSLYALSSLLLFIRIKWQAQVAEGLTKKIRDNLYEHILLIPYSYFVKEKSGELLQRCTSDVEVINRFFNGQLTEIFFIIFSSLVSLITMFKVNFNLALLAFIPIPIVFIYSYFFFKLIGRQFTKLHNQEEKMSGYLQEMLSGIRVVKAFNRENYEINKYQDYSKQYSSILYKLIKYLGTYWGFSYLICFGGILIVVVRGIFLIKGNLLSTGDYFLFISFQAKVLFMIRQLGRILTDSSKLIVSSKRINEVLLLPMENLLSGDKPSLKGEIVFNDVSFSYKSNSAPILNNIDLKIPYGKKVAIMGPTGSGKSSLIQLLARLNEPSNGYIAINGTKLKQINKHYLRKRLGFVLQEPFLFSKTIAENLQMAQVKINNESIYKASRIAHIDEAINGLGDGYQTLIGERGVSLSGGQRQRLAIARSLLKDIDYLIFDDSLSAVDAQTDKLIRDNIFKEFEGITFISITQRILTAKEADLIVVIENGKISQIGNHQELINRDGFYRNLAKIQLPYREVF